MSQASLREQVIIVYDAMRDACLSRAYYEDRLEWWQRVNFGIEVVLALTASASGIGGWAVWQSGTGVKAWAAISGATAAVAVVKPFLAADKRIATYAALTSEYAALFHNFKSLATQIKMDHAITKEMKSAFFKSEKEFARLAQQDTAQPNAKIVARLQDVVNRQLPANSLWLPEDNSH